MSEEVKEQKKLTLIQKLAAIQQELKAPKNQRNNFGGYNYRSAEDILEAVKPLAIKYGAVVHLSDEVMQVGDRIYVRAHVSLFDMDDIGNSISSYALAREEETKKGMDGSQITGAASSYARKYALNGMFAIDDTKDSDATNDHGKVGKPQSTASDILGGGQPKPSKPAPSSKYKTAWNKYANMEQNAGVERDVLAANFKKLCVEQTGKANSTQYTDADWDKVIEFIESFGG